MTRVAGPLIATEWLQWQSAQWRISPKLILVGRSDIAHHSADRGQSEVATAVCWRWRIHWRVVVARKKKSQRG
ncbi:hypothetical protein Q2941_42945 [Bradyrhizobium sp. UFLA05-153]